MVKILYASINNFDSTIQMSRFIESIINKNYSIKLSGYSRFCQSIPIDWNIESLFYTHNKNRRLNTPDIDIYADQIKKFKPDIIISDLEYFTSMIAINLNIPIIQCSSYLLDSAVDSRNKKNFLTQGIQKYSPALKTKNNKFFNIINNNSNYKFVYSHLCDAKNKPFLKNGFNWIRPYHKIGKKSKLCEHNIVYATTHNNKKTIDFIKNYNDIILFSDFEYEWYENIQMKNIKNLDEYYCNLKNCKIFISDGQETFLADAFYNKKKSFIYANLIDENAIINSLYSQSFLTSEIIYDKNKELNNFFEQDDIAIEYSNNKFLHEELEVILNH